MSEQKTKPGLKYSFLYTLESLKNLKGSKRTFLQKISLRTFKNIDLFVKLSLLFSVRNNFVCDKVQKVADSGNL